MSDQEKQLREIQRGEQWLAERLGGRPDVAEGNGPLPSAEAIKKRVRLAIQERWLEQNLEDAIPQDLAERLKVRALAALREQAEPFPVNGRRKTTRGRWYVMAGWGLAAAACLVVYVGVRYANWDGRGGSVAVSLVDPFWGYQEDDLLVSLNQLGDDFDDLEYSLNEQAGFEPSDFMLDDLLFEINRVLTDDDWSS